MQRRTFLKVAGGTLTACGMASPIVSASSNNETKLDIYHQGLELREEHNWSVDEFRAYLNQHGIEYGFKDVRKVVPTWSGSQHEQTDGQVDIETLPKIYLDMHLTLWYLPNNRHTYEFAWDFTIPDGVFVDGNLPPRDIIQIEWQPTETNPVADPYGGNYVAEPPGAPARKAGGIAMLYNDKKAYFNNPNGDDARYQRSWSDYVSADVRHQSGTPQSRDIYIRYYHVYSANTYDITWSYGSPGVDFDTVSKKWVADASATEAELNKSWNCGNHNC